MTDKPRSEWTKAERELERKALDLIYRPMNQKGEKQNMANEKQYDDTNSGAIFTNHNKSNEKQPDWSGPLNFEGTELRLAGWIREDRNGRAYISLKVERMEQAQEMTSPVRKQKQEDIPF